MLVGPHDLGLPIARLIAERHRGTITIGPPGRRGTTVHVELPRDHPEPPKTTATRGDGAGAAVPRPLPS
ncbi:hypothetical protein GCM10023107_94170 [Actinoplanes octamycinicus]|nr:hypothetical protein Aoc01nite_23220 [Actinoplanes octamycinicus]